MSSEPQLAANRANAQLPTGPRKHGLTSSHLIVVDSDREAFESMREALAEELAPQGELESTLFDTTLHANWNIRRCRILEAQMMEGDTDPMLLEQNEAKLRQFDRHARRHESNFHRALKELRALQTERAFRDLALAAQNEPKSAPSPLANTQAARQAYLRDCAANAANSRIEAANLGRLLDRLIDRPVSAPISHARFDEPVTEAA